MLPRSGKETFAIGALGWLLVREGSRMNHKKLYRLYHEEKLMVRRRGGRKRALGIRAPMLLPERLNQRWSLDFIADNAERRPALSDLVRRR
jgi:putative transposase